MTTQQLIQHLEMFLEKQLNNESDFSNLCFGYSACIEDIRKILEIENSEKL